MIFDDKFWGNNKYDSKHNIEEVLNLIPDNITVKIMSQSKESNTTYNIPFFMLTDKLPQDTIKRMESLHEGYTINIFENTIEDKWKYLMTIEPLRYYSDITHANILDGRSEFRVYDKYGGVAPLVIIPFASSETNHLLQSMSQAEYICKNIVDDLNNK